MAMTKVKDLVVKVREYQDAQGQKKAQWAPVGVLMRGDDGNEFLMLDRHFNPAGIANPDNRNTVLISMFDPKPRDGQGNGGGQSRENQGGGFGAGGRPGGNDMDDSIPFAPSVL